MSTEFAREFDVGPLSWVHGEIDQALARGIDALATFRGNFSDAASLKHARSHIHQAAGAIQMVGLDAITAYTDEIERLLARIDELPVVDAPGIIDRIDRACRRLQVLLDEIANGAMPVPLKLFPEYEAMQKARGLDTSSAADLFYPDLDVRPPRKTPREIMPAASLTSYLLKQRRDYQRGLLEWLRGNASGGATMRDAIAAIEEVTTSPNLRAFWWTVGAFLEALERGLLDKSFGAKQLVARIDMQIRRVTEGSAKVSDRLRREVLYFVAISAPGAQKIEAIQRAYRLAELIPSTEALNADVVRLQPILREAREQVASAKDAWLKAASGRADVLARLRQTMAAVDAKAAEIGPPALVKLTSALASRLAQLPEAGVPEPVAMEFATAFLLAESAFENYTNLSPDFAKQVDAMLARLDAAQAGREADGSAPVLDEMSRRAQERALLSQVMREVQVNLRHMEQVLDAFFRDSSKRADLAGLAKDSQQIRGALRMLDLDDADRLLALCQSQIETYADSATVIDDAGLELLAESLSGLGFYVEAVLQQRPDRERLIAPLIAKRLGVAPEPVEADRQSVEHSVIELRAALPRLINEVKNAPADGEARAELRGKLVSLRDDAELIGDMELATQAAAVLREIDAGAADAAVAAKVDQIVDAGVAPAPEISEETQRLLATDASALDAELLDIYLTEADEVLDTVDEGYRALSNNSADRDALVTVRRQFHTLKGSGRMVGLTELGELAWGVERVHNRILEDDRRVTPTLLGLIHTAQTSFRDWVRELRETGRITTDPAALQAALDAVEAELPGFAPTPIAAVAASAAGAAVAEPGSGPRHGVPLVAEAGDAATGVLPVEHSSFAAVEPSAESASGAASTLDLEIIELPEFGAPIFDGTFPDVTTIDGPVEESIDIGLPSDGREAQKPVLRVVADNTAVQAADARSRASGIHAPGLTLLTDAPRLDEGATPPDTDEVSVGPVTLSASLWKILCDEADQNVAVLQHEVSLMQFDPDHLPVASMVRASHTLCGIHRTGGIALIAGTAQALELALLALEQHGAPFPSRAHPVLARASAGLAHLVSRVKALEGFSPRDEREAADICIELDELRQEATANAPTLDLLLGDEDLEQAPTAVDLAGPEGVADSATEAEPQASGESGTSGGIGTRRGPAAFEEPAPLRELEIAGEPEFAAELEAQTPAPAEAAPEVALEATPEAAAMLAAATQTTPAPGLGAADQSAASWAPAAQFQPPPPAAPAIPPDETLLDVTDDVDEMVVPIFLEEAAELYPRAGDELRAWRRNPEDGTVVAELRRTLHTLKGSARMAGAMRLGELAHRMESRLSVEGPQLAVTPELFEALDTDLDRIGFLLDALREGKSNVVLPWLALPAEGASPPPAAAVPGAASMAAATEAGSTIPGMAAPEAPTSVTAGTPRGAGAIVERRRTPRPRDVEIGARAMLRVRADIVDRLVNEAGEVAIARARVEGELRTLKANLLELTSSVIRLRSQVREIELQAETQIQSRMSAVQSTHEGFDPLELDRYTRFQELTRSLAEGVNDVSTVQQSLLKNLDDADVALLAQARLSRDVQQRLLAIRTVPFNSLTERLYRTLRKTARELGKRANLEINGAQTELDRSVLEKLAGPLEHLLRNALDHGIESRDERIAAGKSETGEIQITVRQAGNEIAIELADDGRGIDFARVRERAVEAGLIAADAEPTEQQLVECLFQPGFSTAQELTQISGRGIGMDVVRNEIVSLGGRVDVHSEAGKGTRFNLFLPLTLAVAQAVLVRAMGRLWALPGSMVEQVQQVKPEAVASMYVKGSIDWRGQAYPFHYLSRLLGDAEATPELSRYNSVLIVKSGQGTIAIHADEMVGNQEVVVKNIGPQLARVTGLSGATVLGTGEIVLIVNPVQLAQRPDVPAFRPAGVDEMLRERQVSVAPARTERKLVMVVDDSLTVRKITSRLLVREGFEVVTARDGVEALQALAEREPDAILLDVEMPRMDGFEFAKTAKGDPKTARIPIIMITSRTADKHRNRAMEIGVDAFLGKPYQEEELLRNLRGMLEAIATV
ncbi:MAG TPA: Hpt domain-containing protein [Casimicrobiaceae bacterium]|nr:Hpt domain-containing protein [Casimicrobiaceae bacterium]